MITDVIIVGAGLSGLTAAQQLQNAGKTVTVLDKGRSVGGRLATRRIGKGIADHGAQFFTVRSDEFQTQVEQWLTNDLVYIWGYGWGDGSIQKANSQDGHPRYVTNGGMNQLAKSLATSIDNIHVSTKVNHINYQDILWSVSDENGNTFNSSVLIMTPPVPQSLALSKNIALSDRDREALNRIEYGPCLCGLFVIDGEIRLPEPGAIQNFDNIVYWVADNQQKGISPDEHIITLHVEADYSREHYDDPPEDNLAFLREALQQYLAEGTHIKDAQLKKWRYSIPLTTHPDDILKASNLPLIFAGDAFGGRGRVEGAYLSGLEAGKVAISLLD
ncbi:MAG: FAD-dependent oxidoreductase [Chloroflexota bacterium]